MSNDTADSDGSENSILTEYGQLHLLLSAEPRVLHEAIYTCDPDQLTKIMSIMEDQLTDCQYHGPGDLDPARQFLSVWFMALRAWDHKTTPDGDNTVTELDFTTLKYDQHWD